MAGVRYFSIQTYTYMGGDQLFTVPFPFIMRQDVAVYRNGTQLNPSNVQWVTDTQVRIINTGLNTGDRIVLRRFTRKDRRWAEYNDGSMLTENDLNITTVQLLYLIQELYDFGIAGNSGDPPPGGVGGPGDPGDPGNNELIDRIIDELIGSQLFQNLIELIELVDINAESIMSNIINTHERWGEDRRYSGLIRKLDEGLEDVDTRITEERWERITESAAAAGELFALQARFNGAEADFIQFTEVYASDEEARTLRIELAESRIGDVEVDVNGFKITVPNALSRIGTIETTYATRDYAETYTQTQLDARFVPANLNGYLNATSVIQGIKATADGNRASVESVTSYLVGSGVTFNPDGTVNWPANPTGGIAYSLSGLQFTVGGHSTQLGTELAFRQAMASKFVGPNADPSNVAGIVAGIETAYKTYADQNSATAQRVTTLETNRQPIFYQDNPPDPTTFVGTPFPTHSFPVGSMWFQRQTGDQGQTIYMPFRWQHSNSFPAGHASYGPYVTGSTIGRWVEVKQTEVYLLRGEVPTWIDDAKGSLLQTIEETYIRDDQVGGRIQSTIQSAWGANWNAISQRMTSWISADGPMYAGWDIRINMSGANGVPVIAGVGLGMQYDTTNPNANAPASSFIVMADKFAIVRPPIAGQPVNLQTAVVPFVVDSTTGNVMIEDTLIVRNLRAYDGVMARLQFGQLNNTQTGLENPSGMRLVLPSNTADFNAGAGLSPFTGGPQKFLIWAGSGTQMSDSTATFYVDTDGNSKFTGEVLAGNIGGGTFQNATDIAWDGSVGSTSFTQLGGTFVLPAPTRSGQLHRPIVMLNVHVQASASRCISQIVVEQWNPTFQSWQTVGGGDLGQAASVSMNHPITFTAPTTGSDSTFRVLFRQLLSTPVATGMTGLIIGIR
jgi:hypothetical protein